MGTKCTGILAASACLGALVATACAKEAGKNASTQFITSMPLMSYSLTNIVVQADVREIVVCAKIMDEAFDSARHPQILAEDNDIR